MPEEKIEKNFIEFVIPGIIVTETSTKECDENTPNHPEKVEIPEHSFGFRFYKQTFITRGSEVLKGEPRDHSNWFYEGCEMSIKEVLKLGDEYSTLKDNMQGSDYKAIVWNMFGQAIPLGKGDVVIKPVPLHETPRWRGDKCQEKANLK